MENSLCCSVGYLQNLYLLITLEPQVPISSMTMNTDKKIELDHLRTKQTFEFSLLIFWIFFREYKKKYWTIRHSIIKNRCPVPESQTSLFCTSTFYFFFSNEIIKAGKWPMQFILWHLISCQLRATPLTNPIYYFFNRGWPTVDFVLMSHRDWTKC